MDTPLALFKIAQDDVIVKHFLDLWLAGRFTFDEMLNRCLMELSSRHYNAIDRWKLEYVDFPSPDLFDLAWDIRQKRLIKHICHATYIYKPMLKIIEFKSSRESTPAIISIHGAQDLILSLESLEDVK